MANEMVVATPQMRGKSDVITNYPIVEGSVIAPGTVVMLNSDGYLVKFDGSNPAVGVAGYLEKDGRQSVVKTGLAVPVLIKEGDAPDIGETIYIDNATGVFTATSGASATATKAVVVSAVDTGIDALTLAAVENVVMIDFPGGL